jgi:periplasmic divalent cation tolerance protein
MIEKQTMKNGIILISTFSDETSLINLSRIVVNEKKICACVNYTPVKSIYRWRSVLQHDNEFIAFFKSTEDHTEELKSEIKKNHSYELPEIVIVKMNDISPEYLNWIYYSTHSENNTVNS